MRARTILILVAAASAAPAAAQSPQLGYVALDPCRIVDTRLSAAGALVTGTPRTFHAVGSASDFAAQGGAAGGCAIPGFNGATARVRAVAFNFVAVNPQGAGNLRAWASDQAVPNASVLNYAAVGGLNIANSIIVPVRQDAEGNDLSVRADVSGTHLVVDVVGYFAPLSAVSGAEPNLRIVRGVIIGTGGTCEISQGAGFTCTRKGPGSYSIVFDTPFDVTPVSGLPIPIVSPLFRFFTLFASSPSEIVIVLRDSAGTITDGNFSFLVVGQGGAAAPAASPRVEVSSDGVTLIPQ